MFKPSEPQTSPSLFHSWQSQLSGKKLASLSDPMAWHNIFRIQITVRVDERPFSVLYNQKTGRANAPIRQLVAMNILKEGHGWSDQQLFEQCRFNILVMNALGMSNVDDEVPVESTWYLFRQKLYEYQKKEGKDLIGSCFAQLTREQAGFFGVSGEKLRMDSKLMGSNIAKSTRLQLVINCLQEFYKSLKEQDKNRLAPDDRSELEKLSKQKAGQIVYQLTPDDQGNYLHQLGALLVRLVDEYNDKDNDKHGLLSRILTEQYTIEQEAIEVRKNKDIHSNSLQSVYDEDAAFRTKGNQKVQGYSVNVSETCNDEGLNLLTDVKVEKATHADVNFVEQAIEQSEKVVGQIKEAYMDGAYNSLEHTKNMEDKTFYFTGMQGAWSKFEYKWENHKLIVTDTTTGIEYETAITKSGKYRISMQAEGKQSYKYIEPEAVECYFRRKQILELPEAVRNIRPNVEATIFQLCFLSRNNKTRYRGMFKHQLWANCRGLWINARRIQLYLMGENCPEVIKQRVIVAINGILVSISCFLNHCTRQWDKFITTFNGYMSGKFQSDKRKIDYSI